jgi:CxxC-x17-CxxC domain-containing protein
MNIALPRKWPIERHQDRMKLRLPRKLWKRTCAKCSKEHMTNYSPERTETVYCEECYLKEVY